MWVFEKCYCGLKKRDWMFVVGRFRGLYKEGKMGTRSL
jgi:hypothetical protein